MLHLGEALWDQARAESHQAAADDTSNGLISAAFTHCRSLGISVTTHNIQFVRQRQHGGVTDERRSNRFPSAWPGAGAVYRWDCMVDESYLEFQKSRESRASRDSLTLELFGMNLIRRAYFHAGYRHSDPTALTEGTNPQLLCA